MFWNVFDAVLSICSRSCRTHLYLPRSSAVTLPMVTLHWVAPPESRILPASPQGAPTAPPSLWHWQARPPGPSHRQRNHGVLEVHVRVNSSPERIIESSGVDSAICMVAVAPAPSSRSARPGSMAAASPLGASLSLSPYKASAPAWLGAAAR
jgi:hypothetical protein